MPGNFNVVCMLNLCFTSWTDSGSSPFPHLAALHSSPSPLLSPCSLPHWVGIFSLDHLPHVFPSVFHLLLHILHSCLVYVPVLFFFFTQCLHAVSMSYLITRNVFDRADLVQIEQLLVFVPPVTLFSLCMVSATSFFFLKLWWLLLGCWLSVLGILSVLELFSFFFCKWIAINYISQSICLSN